MEQITIRIHFEKSVKVNVPRYRKSANRDEFINNAISHHKNNLDTKDLEWLGTYVEDELGNEIVTIS